MTKLLTSAAAVFVVSLVTVTAQPRSVPTPDSVIGWAPCADYKLLFNAILLGGLEKTPPRTDEGR